MIDSLAEKRPLVPRPEREPNPPNWQLKLVPPQTMDAETSKLAETDNSMIVAFNAIKVTTGALVRKRLDEDSYSEALQKDVQETEPVIDEMTKLTQQMVSLIDIYEGRLLEPGSPGYSKIVGEVAISLPKGFWDQYGGIGGNQTDMDPDNTANHFIGQEEPFPGYKLDFLRFHFNQLVVQNAQDLIRKYGEGMPDEINYIEINPQDFNELERMLLKFPGVLHDIKTPWTGIKGHIQLSRLPQLIERLTDEQRQRKVLDAATIINRSNNQSAQIIEDKVQILQNNLRHQDISGSELVNLLTFGPHSFFSWLNTYGMSHPELKIEPDAPDATAAIVDLSEETFRSLFNVNIASNWHKAYKSRIAAERKRLVEAGYEGEELERLASSERPYTVTLSIVKVKGKPFLEIRCEDSETGYVKIDKNGNIVESDIVTKGFAHKEGGWLDEETERKSTHMGMDEQNEHVLKEYKAYVEARNRKGIKGEILGATTAIMLPVTGWVKDTEVPVSKTG